jgi:hypothetical protein
VPPADVWGSEERLDSEPEVVLLSSRAIDAIARCYMIHPSNSVVRRTTLMSAGGFFDQLWGWAEDVNLMLRLFEHADRVLYVPSMVTRYRLPVGNSVSLQQTEHNQLLQDLLSAQEVRLRSRRPELRAAARAREAWACRRGAISALRHGQRRDAVAFARQAVAIAPTLGGFKFMAMVMTKATLGRVS